MQEIFQWINGKNVLGQSDEISVLNPATTKEIGRLKAATSDQVAAAVKAARQSFDRVASGPTPLFVIAKP
jgi:acyl-CoA reductase-like NAD-dependent aldehyde dehydrogenase